MYPNLNNIINDKNTPIPIETIFYLEEAERDNYFPNRFYFNFPESWSTAEKGESIIGVRNMYINARRRKLNFKLSIRKYYRDDFNKIKKENPNMTIDEIYNKIPNKRKSICSCDVISWLPVEHDLREVFNDLNTTIIKTFEEYNNKIEKLNGDELKKLEEKQNEIATKEKDYKALLDVDNELKDLCANLSYELAKCNDPDKVLELEEELKAKEIDYKTNQKALNELNTEIKKLKEEEIKLRLNPYFEQEDINNRDLQLDGYYDYDKKMFIEVLYSEKNNDNVENNILNNNDYYIDFKILFQPRPFLNNKQNNQPNTIYDFVDVFNIGKEIYQNDPEKYLIKYKNEDGKEEYLGRWMRQIKFENVWDRHSAKIYSSFATDNSKGYLGNSQIFYHTIKYFKLNSSDQKFWIEFYSARHHTIPLVLPLNESFNLEIVFTHYQKLLYV